MKSGGKYRWHNRYETPPIACPPTLVEALEAYAAGSTRDSADRTEGTPRYSPLAARLLAGALAKTQEGTGDVTGYMLARKLLAGGCGELEALDVLALTTGMRQGELLALVWEDVDLEIGVIHVRHTLQHGSAGAWTLESPKTAKSRREVELNPSTVEALQAHRTAQLEARLAAGPLWHDHGLVFTRGDGEPMRGTHLLQRHFHPFLRRAGLPLIRFHDLRHTAATQLLLQGINSKVVQERLGHSNVGITLDRYSHVLPGMQREAALAMERLFQRDPTRGPMVRVK